MIPDEEFEQATRDHTREQYREELDRMLAMQLAGAIEKDFQEIFGADDE